MNVWLLMAQCHHHSGMRYDDIAVYSTDEIAILRLQEHLADGYQKEEGFDCFFLVELEIDQVDQMEFFHYRFDKDGNFLPERSQLESGY